MNINEIHNTNLVAFDEVENYIVALKNFVLYTKIDDAVVIALSKEYMSISLDYISKIDVNEEIVFLDEISFEKLYNRFLEIKTDKEMSAIQQEQEDATLSDDDFSVSEFLKVGSDILTSEELNNLDKTKLEEYENKIKELENEITAGYYDLEDAEIIKIKHKILEL